MATRFINRGINIEHQGGHFVMTAYDRNDNLAAKLDNAVGTTEDRYIPLGGLENVTASKSITYSDHGKTFVANGTATVILTLPATKKGITFTVVIGQLPGSGAGTAFSPAAVDKIFGNGTSAVDNKDIVCVVASDRIGDAITLVGDGLDGWYITSVVGTWTAEA